MLPQAQDMKHHLTFKDSKSDKFWQIETNGKSFTVTYGKTGTAGTTQTKTFESEEKCLKEAEKLLNEKLKKGYIMSQSKATSAKEKKSSSKTTSKSISKKIDYLKEWQAIVDAKDKHKALVKHFRYLADTPGTEKIMTSILEAIMKEVQEASCNEEALTITFPKFKVVATPPMKNIPKKHPESFQNHLMHHEIILISEYWIQLGAHKGFNVEDGWFDDMEDETDPLLLEFAKAAKRLISPISDGISGNYWLYHPSKKNVFGQPAIYYLEHDGMEFKNPQRYNAGTVFLTMLAELLEIPAADIMDNDPQSWWSSLDSDWRNLLARHGIKDSSQVITALGLQELSIDSGCPVKTLSPLSAMTKLRKLIIEVPFVNDISMLENHTELEELAVINAKDLDISPLAKLKQLKKIDLSGSSVKTLNPLADIFVRSLKLNNTALEDVSELSELNYHHVYHLELSGTRVEDLTPLKRLTNKKILNISNTRVKSLDFLSDWSLDKIELDKTSVTSLKPLDRHFLSEINFRETPVPLEEAIRFKSTTSWWCQVRCDFTGNEVFTSKGDKIDFNLPNFENVVAAWVSRILNQIEEGRWSYGGAYEIKNDQWNPAEDEAQIKKLLNEYQQRENVTTPSETFDKLRSIAVQLEYKKNMLNTVLPGQWIHTIGQIKLINNKAFLGRVEREINKSLTGTIASKNMKEGARLFNAYMKVLPFLSEASPAVFLNGVDVRQAIAANGILLYLKDENALDLVKPLIPQTVTEPELAHSLALLYHIKNDKVKMLGCIKQAIYLGCDKEKFLSEPIFRDYKNDPEFLVATRSEKYEKLFLQYCETPDPKKLLPLILDLPTFKGKPLMELLMSQLYNAFIELIKSNKLENAKDMLKAYIRVIPEIGHTDYTGKGLETGKDFNLREAIASNAVVLAILAKDDEVLEMAGLLIPDTITDNDLAFNLACLYAIKKDREKLLQYTQMAVRLGKKKEQFMADADFDNYKTDNQFLKIFA